MDDSVRTVWTWFLLAAVVLSALRFWYGHKAHIARLRLEEGLLGEGNLPKRLLCKYWLYGEYKKTGHEDLIEIGNKFRLFYFLHLLLFIVMGGFVIATSYGWLP